MPGLGGPQEQSEWANPVTPAASSPVVAWRRAESSARIPAAEGARAARGRPLLASHLGESPLRGVVEPRGRCGGGRCQSDGERSDRDACCGVCARERGKRRRGPEPDRRGTRARAERRPARPPARTADPTPTWPRSTPAGASTGRPVDDINTPETQADAIVDLIKRGPLPHLVTLTETAIRAAGFVADALCFPFAVTGERSNRVVTLWDPDRFELLPPPGSRDVGVVDSYQHCFHVAYLRHITSGRSLAYTSAHMPHKKNKDTAWANLADKNTQTSFFPLIYSRLCRKRASSNNRIR